MINHESSNRNNIAITLTGLVLLMVFMMNSGCSYYKHKKAVEHYVTALSLKSADFDEDAIAELQQAVRLDNKLSVAYSMLGDMHRQLGQYEEAADAYEKACKMDSWSFADHLHLGEVYKALKRFADAIKVLKRACELKPNHAGANYTLAVCYYETKEYKKASEFCSKAARLDPTNKDILASLGDIESKLGDNYKAINAYKQALELNPNQPKVMTRLALVYIHMKRYAPAKLILSKAIEQEPSLARTHVILGYCMLMEGSDLNGAMKQYKKALQIDSNNTEALNGLGVISMMLYQQDTKRNSNLAKQALEYWYKSLEINPDQSKIRKLVDRYKPNGG